MKKAWMTAVAAAAVLAAAAAANAERSGEWRLRQAVDAAVDAARAGLAEAPIEAGTPVAILPVQGDLGGLAERRLRVALYEAGKNCVAWKDEPALDTILEALDWKELKTGILDPATIGQIGKVQGAKVLLLGWLENTGRSERRPEIELELHAYEVETARQIWGGVFRQQVATLPPPPTVVSTPWPLNMDVEVRAADGAEREAGELEVFARGRLADLGYHVASRQDADMGLTLDVDSALFDREREWQTYKGSVKASLWLRGKDERLLGEGTLSGKGAPGLDEDGHRNLAYVLEPQLGAWLGRTLKPDAVEFAATRLEMVLADPVETSADHAAIGAIQDAIEELPGVRSAALVSQDDTTGAIAFKVVFKPSELPEGLPNALHAAHPELLDKYLR